MGHLPIVNENTLHTLKSDGYISCRGDLKNLWVKTLADIFSDVLATRAGDYVFPWVVAGPNSPNLGFQYKFKISNRPIYVPNDEFPVKLEVFDSYEEFVNPVYENEALDLWTPELLWNAIGKKSLGRGRSLSHQLPMEDEKLLSLLNSKNQSAVLCNVTNRRVFSNFQTITINTT